MRDTPDTPLRPRRRQARRHRRTSDVVLSTDAARRSRRSARRCCGPATCPAGLGDMDSSLYLLFKAIREHSTVALSGESADEVFGGYRWFHDPSGA